jgi:DNA-binding transcriptional LysR family regulator
MKNIETINRSVEAGLGLSTLPSGPLMRDSGVIYPKRRELSPAGRAFLTLLTREIGSG